MRSTSRSASAVVVLAAWLTACGDPLLTAQDRGDGVFGVRGLVEQPGHGAPGSDYEVAVIYLRAVLSRAPRPGPYQVETEVIRGSIDGSLPAEFHVELTDAPEASPWEDRIIYSDIGTGRTDGVFSSGHAPAGVRLGQLMIGPAQEIAALPSLIDFAQGESRTMHRTLAAYLPNTTITGYQVIYAEGVKPGDVIYPTYVPSRGESVGGMAIGNGFTLVDARKYFAATAWQACADSVLGPLYDEPGFAACLVANKGLIDCLAQCSLASCQQTCEAAFPGELDQDGCLSLTAVPKLEASCGPVRSPRPYLVEILSKDAALSVILGDDDIKPGLRILQSTTL
jgi:hypothetical protein